MDFYYDELGPKCAISVIIEKPNVKIYVPDYLEQNKIEAWINKAGGKFEKLKDYYVINYTEDVKWLLYYYYPFFLE